jgi:hypothetical protein
VGDDDVDVNLAVNIDLNEASLLRIEASFLEP